MCSFYRPRDPGMLPGTPEVFKELRKRKETRWERFEEAEEQVRSPGAR